MLRPSNKLESSTGISRSCGQIPTSKSKRFIRRSHDITPYQAPGDTKNCWLWTPQGGLVWKYITGLRIRLEDIDICKHKDYEFPLIQRLALNRLNDWNFCNDLSLRYDPRNPTVLKILKTHSKSVARLFYRHSRSQFSLPDIFKFKKKCKSLVFGIPIAKAMHYDERFYIDSRKSRKKDHSPTLTTSSLPLRLHTPKTSITNDYSSDTVMSDSSDFLKTSIYNIIVNSNLIPDSSYKPYARGSLESRLPTIPLFVQNCLKYLETKCLHVQGIFRVSCSKKRMKQLKDDIDCGKKVYLYDNPSPHDIAGLLKEYFRELPEPLMTDELHQAFLATKAIENAEAQIKVINYLLCLLPPTNRNTLKALLQFLHKVTSHSANVTKANGVIIYGNKMDSRNLAVIFGPNILHPYRLQKVDMTKYNQTMMEERKDAIRVIQFMIDNVDKLFKVEAELQNELYLILSQNNPSLLETSFADRYKMLLKTEEENLCDEEDEDDHEMEETYRRLRKNVAGQGRNSGMCKGCSLKSVEYFAQRRESSPLSSSGKGEQRSSLTTLNKHLKRYLLSARHHTSHKRGSVLSSQSEEPSVGHYKYSDYKSIDTSTPNAPNTVSHNRRPLVLHTLGECHQPQPIDSQIWQRHYTKRGIQHDRTSNLPTSQPPYTSRSSHDVITPSRSCDINDYDSLSSLSTHEDQHTTFPQRSLLMSQEIDNEEAESAYSSYDVLNSECELDNHGNVRAATSPRSPGGGVRRTEREWLGGINKLPLPYSDPKYSPSNKSLPPTCGGTSGRGHQGAKDYVCGKCHTKFGQNIQRSSSPQISKIKVSFPILKSLPLSQPNVISKECIHKSLHPKASHLNEPTNQKGREKSKNTLKHSMSNCQQRLQKIFWPVRIRSNSAIQEYSLSNIQSNVINTTQQTDIVVPPLMSARDNLIKSLDPASLEAGNNTYETLIIPTNTINTNTFSPLLLHAPIHSPSNLSSSTCLSLGYESGGGVSSSLDVAPSICRDKKRNFGMDDNRSYNGSKLPWQLQARPLNKTNLFEGAKSEISRSTMLRHNFGGPIQEGLINNEATAVVTLPQIFISEPPTGEDCGTSSQSLVVRDPNDTSTGSLTTTEGSMGSSAEPSLIGGEDEPFERSDRSQILHISCPLVSSSSSSTTTATRWCTRCDKSLSSKTFGGSKSDRRNTDHGELPPSDASFRIPKRKSLKRRTTLINRMGDSAMSATNIAGQGAGTGGLDSTMSSRRRLNPTRQDRYKPKETTV